MKYFILYKTTNVLNGKFYIGVHSSKYTSDNYLGSGVALNSAIKIYGRENFTRENLRLCKSEEEMYCIESKIVSRKLVNSKMCYNISYGGFGAGSGSKNHMFGKTPWNIGTKVTSPITLRRMRDSVGDRCGSNNSFYNKRHSLETKLKISQKAKDRNLVGSNNPFYGKRHSKKSIEKISSAQKNMGSDFRLRQSISKSSGDWITPYGTFISALRASRVVGCSKSTIILRCKKNNLMEVGYNYQQPDKYKGSKTWMDLGYGFESK